MSDSEIQLWLEQARKAGFSDTQIRDQLLKNGWNGQQIDQVLAFPIGVPPSPVQEYTPRTYTVGSHIMRRSWAVFREHWLFLLLLSLPNILAIVILYGSFSLGVVSGNYVFVIIGIVVGLLLYVLLNIFATVMLTSAVANNDWSYASVFSGSIRLFGKYIYTNILAALVMLGGYFLFFLPGIFMMLAFTTLPYVIAKEGKHGFAALTRCYALARNFRGNIFGDLLFLGLLNLLFYVGFFIIFAALLFLLSLLGPLGSVMSIALTFSPVILFFLLPIFALIYFHFIHYDLAVIRPIGADPDVEHKGRVLCYVYGSIGVIFFIMLITPFFSFFSGLYLTQ